MDRIVFVLVGVVALVGAISCLAPAVWPVRWRGRPDFWRQAPSGISRLEVDLSRPRSRQPQRFTRCSGQ
jgi:hypothetical protein